MPTGSKWQKRPADVMATPSRSFASPLARMKRTTARSQPRTRPRRAGPQGQVVARVIEHADTATLNAFVNEAVSTEVSLVATDDNGAYRKLNKAGYAHGVISHNVGQ